MKNDKYSKARGGHSRLLDISCANGHHVCFYQKDGPGLLKRMYVDRMIGLEPTEPVLKCPECEHELGLRTIYARENRPAYKLFRGAVSKKIAKQPIAK